MKTNIKKEILNSLVNKVVYPAEELLIEQSGLEGEEAVKVLKEIGFFKFALFPFLEKKSKKEIETNLKNLEKLYHLNMNLNVTKSIIAYYGTLWFKWLKDNNIELSYEYKLLIGEGFYNLIEEKQEQNDFFDFDSDRDEVINSMHCEEKISAKEFFETNEIDMDLVYDLEDYIDKYFDLKLDDSFFIELKEIIYKLISIFEMSLEFKDLGITFEKLLEVIRKLEKQEEFNLKIIKMFIDAIMEDLEKWIKTNYKKIIDKELENWQITKKDRPKKITYKLFEEWFEVSLASMVYDFEEEPIDKG